MSPDYESIEVNRIIYGGTGKEEMLESIVW